MSRRALRLVQTLFAFLLLPGAMRAAAVKIWVCDTAADFSAGEARGISVSADGTLLPGRILSRVEGVSEAVLFTAAPGRSGELYVGTGDSGKILRVSSDGKVDTYATLEEKEVTALKLGPDGSLYAGASPGGKVYRITNGKASRYYDTKAEYVWALAFDGPTLYVGTGLPGEIHRVRSANAGERIHVTPDAHVRSLYVDSRNRVWAGTSGSGLVLRLDRDGHPTTLYDSGKPEVTAIVADKSGRVWAAAGTAEMAPSVSEPPPVPQSAPSPKTPKAGSPTDDEDKSRPEVSVSVSSVRLAPPRGSSKSGYSSEIVLFEEGEPARVVWSSADEVVFDLATDDGGGGVLAGTGPKGKLYAVAADSSALVRTFDEKQVTFFAGDDVGTNASSALYRRAAGAVSGEYVSAVKDTGRTSRYGAFRWDGDAPAGGRVEFAFRSGEAAVPDTTWSSWSAWAGGGGDKSLTIAAPEGRFLQWKLRMAGEGARGAAVRRTEAAYRNRNAAPVIENLVALDPAEVLLRSGSGGSNVLESAAPDEKGIFTGLDDSKSEGSPRKLYRKGFRTLQWKASDPDGDALAYELEFHAASSSKWIPLRKEIRDGFYAFDSTSLPDGDYVFRVTASDAESNPGEAKTAVRESASVKIDNTPPVIRSLGSSPGLFQFEATDAASPLTEAEYSVDARKWTRVEPRDGLSDSPHETYAVRLPPEARGGYLLVRVTDASRNVATASFSAP